MKLLGVTDGKTIVASMSHYDYITHGELMADGGNPLTNKYAGYNRFSGGETLWFEVAQDFEELFNDYNHNNKNRKYGVWKIEDVRILKKEEWPDCESIEELSRNYLWGTNGSDGKEKLKYVLLKNCSLDHLKAIIKTQGSIHSKTKEVIEYLISEKTKA